MSKVSLASQIAAIEVAAGGRSATMSRGQKELHETHLRAAIASLRWLRDNEAAIRAFVEARWEARS